MHAIRLFVGLPLVAVAGCAAATKGDHSSAPIMTDRAIYQLQDTARLARLTIRMTYRNTTGKDVYLPTCNGPQPPRLQKQVNGTWVVAFAPNVLACEGTPITVRNNDSYEYSFNILAGMPGTNFLPRFSVSDIPGDYRILWEIFRGTVGDPRRPTTTRDPLPLDQEVSNTFKIVVH
jgi:hypothetical protein